MVRNWSRELWFFQTRGLLVHAIQLTLGQVCGNCIVNNSFDQRSVSNAVCFPFPGELTRRVSGCPCHCSCVWRQHCCSRLLQFVFLVHADHTVFNGRFQCQYIAFALRLVTHVTVCIVVVQVFGFVVHIWLRSRCFIAKKTVNTFVSTLWCDDDTSD